MMFERKLAEPPHGWGIHKNSFFYIDSDKTRINEVICHERQGTKEKEEKKGNATAVSYELTSKYQDELKKYEPQEAKKAVNNDHEEGEEEKKNEAAAAAKEDEDSKEAKNWFEKDLKELE